MFSSFLSSLTCAACWLLIYHTFIAKYIVNSKCCIKFSQKAAKLYGLVLCCSSLLVPHNVLMAQSGLNCDSRVVRAAAAAELARSLARNVDKWVSFVLSEFLAPNRFVRSCPAALSESAHPHALSGFRLPVTKTYSLSRALFGHNARPPLRVLFTPACSCRCLVVVVVVAASLPEPKTLGPRYR